MSYLGNSSLGNIYVWTRPIGGSGFVSLASFCFFLFMLFLFWDQLSFFVYTFFLLLNNTI